MEGTQVLKEMKEEPKNICDELKEEIKEQWKKKEMQWEERIKMLEEKLENMQTELCRPISGQAEREEEGADVPANSVMAETTGVKLAITKVNDTSREWRKIKIGFWNVAGLDNKDPEFFDYLNKFDIIGMVETWIEKNCWSRVEKYLPEAFRWRCQYARREKIYGRAIGGIITGIKKEITEETEETETNSETKEGIQIRKVTLEKENWKIVTVYNNDKIHIRNFMENIKHLIPEENEENLVIGGDFNVKIKEEGTIIWGDDRDEISRKSKDKHINKEGNTFLKEVEERGWDILNGKTEGDEEGEFTYIGTREEESPSVIDYVLTNAETRGKIDKLIIEDRTESDHMPICVHLQLENDFKAVKDNLQHNTQMQQIWTEESIEKYKKLLENSKLKSHQDLEEEWDKLKEAIEEAIQKATPEEHKRETTTKNSKMAEKIWWNEECLIRKNELREVLRRTRRDNNLKEYRDKRKEYEKFCKEMEEKYKKTEIKEIKEITEAEAWKYINKERKKKTCISKQITVEEREQLYENFMKLLQGKGEKETKSEQRTREKEDSEEITFEEMEIQISKLKEKEAAGEDGIQNEAWLYSTKNIQIKLLNIMNRIWKGEGFPMCWRRGVIAPIYKKGYKHKAENYRRITLLNTAYKIYAMILEEKLKEEVIRIKKKKGIQAGFRRGTMDNIYILNYVTEKEIQEERRKVFTFVVDLKAAFDIINRENLWLMMKGKEINKHLVNRIEEIYEETSYKVLIEGEYSKDFWTESGVRQGCPLTPTLFAIYKADIEEELRKRLRQVGGIAIDSKKVWSLSYEGDIVLLAKDANEMHKMIETLERILKKRDLSLSTERLKMMTFRSGRKGKNENFSWNEKPIEEVNRFKYLGYTLQTDNDTASHIRETVRKAISAMKQVREIGQRKFARDFEKRVLMFNHLINSILMYGAEIWGWREHELMESCRDKYIKWITLDCNTQNCIVWNKTRRPAIESGKRASIFEKTIAKSDNKLLKECLEEIKKRESKRTRTRWERDREIFHKKACQG